MAAAAAVAVKAADVVNIIVVPLLLEVVEQEEMLVLKHSTTHPGKAGASTVAAAVWVAGDNVDVDVVITVDRVQRHDQDHVAQLLIVDLPARVVQHQHQVHQQEEDAAVSAAAVIVFNHHHIMAEQQQQLMMNDPWVVTSPTIVDVVVDVNGASLVSQDEVVVEGNFILHNILGGSSNSIMQQRHHLINIYTLCYKIMK